MPDAEEVKTVPVDDETAEAIKEAAKEADATTPSGQLTRPTRDCPTEYRLGLGRSLRFGVSPRLPRGNRGVAPAHGERDRMREGFGPTDA